MVNLSAHDEPQDDENITIKILDGEFKASPPISSKISNKTTTIIIIIQVIRVRRISNTSCWSICSAAYSLLTQDEALRARRSFFSYTTGFAFINPETIFTAEIKN